MAENQTSQAGQPQSGDKSQEDSKAESSSSGTSDIQGSPLDKDQINEIPTEILDALPAETRQAVSSFMAMVHSQPSKQSPLAKNITPEHISKILVNSDNDSRRDFDLKRLAMGAVLVLVAMILVYAAKTKDKDLSEKIFVASIAAVGGAGVGYGVGRGSRD
jgi:hypothetical protein